MVVSAAVMLAACAPRPAGRLYVTSGFTDEVVVLDPGSGRIIDRLSVDPRVNETDEPHGIAAAPDGRHWYASVSHGDPTVWKFELPGDRLVGRVRLGIPGAGRIGISPDSRRAFVPDYYRDGDGQPGAVAVIELDDLTVIARPTVCPAPHDAEFGPDGTQVAVTCTQSDEIAVLDARTAEEIRRFPTGPGGTDSAVGEVPPSKPLNVVWGHAGDALYVTLHLQGVVRIFTPHGDVIASVAVGEGPAQLALTPDGETLVVANRIDGSASIIDVPGLVERARVPLPARHPHGAAVSPDGRTAFITSEGDVDNLGGVTAVDLDAQTVRWHATAGTFTLGVAYVAAHP